MKNIKTYVKQFKKENKIIFPTWKKLVHTAKKNNWKLLPFSKAERLIREHDLISYTERYRAFVYEYSDETIILYRDDLKGFNRLYTICHEMGHIYLNHTVISNRNENEEIAADEFAELLLSSYKKSLMATNILTLALLAAICFFNSNSTDESNRLKEFQQEITATETTDENNNNIYYVSKSGTKYHLYNCYHINIDKCTQLTLEEVEKLGYEPCKTCRPDKQN